jgi:hypothetical protein
MSIIFFFEIPIFWFGLKDLHKNEKCEAILYPAFGVRPPITDFENTMYAKT